MREKKTCRQEELKQLSTEQLDALLQAALQEKTPDAEVVLPILEELELREKDNPIEVSEKTAAAWEAFQKKTAPAGKQPGKRRWFTCAAAAAAVVLLVTAVIPKVAGVQSIWDALFRLSESVFEFFNLEQTESEPNVNDVFVTENAGLQQVYDKVTELGATENIVPMWLPEGYELAELWVLPVPDGTKVYAKFTKDDKGVAFSYRIYDNTVFATHEKDETMVEMYEYADVSHFIMDNDDILSVSWTIDSAECSILADLTKEDLYRIIKSIYRRKLA